MRPYTSLFAASALLAAPCAFAQTDDGLNAESAELWLSNDTLQLRYITSGSAIGAGNARASIGFFLSEERDLVLDADVLFPADLDLGRFGILFGPRIYAAMLNEENDDIFAIAVGAELRFDITRNKGLAIVGHAFYAPDILTFGTADSLTDLSARIELGLASQLAGFAGMRWFEFDLTDGSGERTLQEEVFVGIRWRF